MAENDNITIRKRLTLDIDTYLSETISIISITKKDIDLFMLNSDLKQYILDESQNLSKNQGISINEAVDKTLSSLGTPDQFAKKVLAEVQQEKRYILGKILIASLLAFFPFIIIIVIIFH